MESIKGLLFLIASTIILAWIIDWITIPYKIDKINRLLEEILKELKR